MPSLYTKQLYVLQQKLFRGGGQQVKVNGAWNGPEWFVIHQERAGDKSKKNI